MEQRQGGSSYCYLAVISGSVSEAGQTREETDPDYIQILDSNIEDNYNIENEYINNGQPVIETEPDVRNISDSDELKVVLPFPPNTKGNVKFVYIAVSCIVIISICSAIFYIISQNMEKKDFEIKENNFTTFGIQTTVMVTSAKSWFIKQVLTVTNGYNNGKWHLQIPVKCDYGSYGSGFQLQVEQDGGTWHDDSGVTDLQLHCSTLKSSTKHLAKKTFHQGFTKSYWKVPVKCRENHYLVAFQLRADVQTWRSWDKVGVTNMNVLCRGPGLYGGEYETLEGYGLRHWGANGEFSEECNNGSAVCAFTLRYSRWKPKYVIDKVGIINVKLMCC